MSGRGSSEPSTPALFHVETAENVVGERGFEPPAPASRTRCPSRHALISGGFSLAPSVLRLCPSLCAWSGEVQFEPSTPVHNAVDGMARRRPFAVKARKSRETANNRGIFPHASATFAPLRINGLRGSWENLGWTHDR